MVSSFWKVVVVVLLLLAVAVGFSLISAWNPQVKTLAVQMATSSHLPLWLMGLAAPIVFVFKKFFGNGSSEKLDSLENDNRNLKAEQARLRQEVAGLNSWRDQELAKQRAEIARLQGDLDALRSRIEGVNGKIATLQATPLDEIGASMTLGEKLAAGKDFVNNDVGMGIIE